MTYQNDEGHEIIINKDFTFTYVCPEDHFGTLDGRWIHATGNPNILVLLKTENRVFTLLQRDDLELDVVGGHVPRKPPAPIVIFPLAEWDEGTKYSRFQKMLSYGVPRKRVYQEMQNTGLRYLDRNTKPIIWDDDG